MAGCVEGAFVVFGLVALGYMWALTAKSAQEQLESGASDARPFLENKLVTATFFMERLLPETALRLARVQAGADSMMALPAEAF